MFEASEKTRSANGLENLYDPQLFCPGYVSTGVRLCSTTRINGKYGARFVTEVCLLDLRHSSPCLGKGSRKMMIGFGPAKRDSTVLRKFASIDIALLSTRLSLFYRHEARD